MYIKFAYKMIIIYCIIEFTLQVLKLQAAIKYGEEDLQGAKVWVNILSIYNEVLQAIT